MRLIDADNLFNNQILVVSNSGSLEAIKKIMDIIKEAPTIDAEPVRHGKWIYTEYKMSNDEKVGYFVCSECNHATWNNKDDHYCFNCGCKMDEEGE